MKETQQTEELETNLAPGVSRRRFLGLAGGIAGAGLLLGAAGCKDDEIDGVELGSDDTGILNYAYALEQVEAAFYTRLIQTPFNGITQEEKARFTEIRDHEIAHREFFKTALGSNAIADLEMNFTSIDFTSRDSVLATAKAFEDLGVSAYNGAGPLIKDPNYLAIAGKIVSVEARHAAYIRDLLSPGSFSGTTDINGLDSAMDPAAVLNIAGNYLKSKISAKNLPTS